MILLKLQNFEQYVKIICHNVKSLSKYKLNFKAQIDRSISRHIVV